MWKYTAFRGELGWKVFSVFVRHAVFTAFLGTVLGMQVKVTKFVLLKKNMMRVYKVCGELIASKKNLEVYYSKNCKKKGLVSKVDILVRLEKIIFSKCQNVDATIFKEPSTLGPNFHFHNVR